jgi:integrase
MKYLAVNLTDTAIKAHAKDLDVSELRDVKNPLCLRFHKNREKATWCYYVNKGNAKQRTRLGYWPSLKTKDVVAMVPGIIEKLHHGKEVQSSNFKTVGELLTWYSLRTSKEALKSKSRRKGVLSAIDRHLLPRLENVSINAVRKVVIDEQLILPLQNQHLKPSTIRQYFAILKRVFASAKELELISLNPMAGMKFRDHVQRRIEPKQSRLLVDDAKGVLEQLVSVSESTRVMILFMLMFATRIGETRQLRWSYIDLNTGLITLPETVTKTGVVHILPITSQAHSMLSEYKANSTGDYLFGGTEPISSSAADKLVREVSKRKWSAHDLRKVARSVWATIGVDYWVAERLLNHKQKGLDLVYINADSMAVKRAALEQYHVWLFGSKPVLIPSVGISDNGGINNNYSNVA